MPERFKRSANAYQITQSLESPNDRSRTATHSTNLEAAVVLIDVVRAAIEEVYANGYESKFESLGLTFHYELIDAQAARIVANPPERALWGVPDNNTGRKLYKLVAQLRKYGIPSDKHQVSISRMSAGGGDQYGSFNMPMTEDGILKVIVDGEEKHARSVKKNEVAIVVPED